MRIVHMNYKQMLTQQQLLKAYDELRLISKSPVKQDGARLTYYAKANDMKKACFIELNTDGNYSETLV